MYLAIILNVATFLINPIFAQDEIPLGNTPACSEKVEESQLRDICEEPNRELGILPEETMAETKSRSSEVDIACRLNQAQNCVGELIGKSSQALGQAQLIATAIQVDSIRPDTADPMHVRTYLSSNQWRKLGAELGLGKYNSFNSAMMVTNLSQSLLQTQREWDQLRQKIKKSSLEQDDQEFSKKLLAKVTATLSECMFTKKTFLERSLQKAKDTRLVEFCSSRINQDLFMYKVYPKWPGCVCGKSGRSFTTPEGKSICVTGINSSEPIDERMPKALQRMISRIPAVVAPLDLELENIKMVGCYADRPSRSGVMKALLKARQLADSERYVSTQMVSPHKEVRACDLSEITFKDKKGNSVKFSVPAYASALDRTQIKKESLQLREFGDQLKVTCPSGTDETTCRNIRLGVWLRNTALDSGLLVLDPTTDQVHQDHFHMSLPMQQEFWEILTHNGSKRPCRERVMTCVNAMNAKDKNMASICAPLDQCREAIE